MCQGFCKLYLSRAYIVADILTCCSKHSRRRTTVGILSAWYLLKIMYVKYSLWMELVVKCGKVQNNVATLGQAWA